MEHEGLVGHHPAFLGCPGVQSRQLGSQEGPALLSVEAAGPPCPLGGAARREGALPLLCWLPVLRAMPGGRVCRAICGRSARAGAVLRLSASLSPPLPSSLSIPGFREVTFTPSRLSEGWAGAGRLCVVFRCFQVGVQEAGGCVLNVATWARGEDRSLWRRVMDVRSTSQAAALQTQPRDVGAGQAGSLRAPAPGWGPTPRSPPLWGDWAGPPTLTPVRIFTVFSRLPRRQRPRGW